MTHPWQPDLTTALHCQFFYEVPEPTCGCRTSPEFCCEDHRPTCELCEDWEPTVQCTRLAHVRVQLDDGRYVDCCDARAHGYAPVVWWSPLYSQPVPGEWNAIMRYFYRQEIVVELAAREHPLFQLIGRAGVVR